MGDAHLRGHYIIIAFKIKTSITMMIETVHIARVVKGTYIFFY